MDIAYNKTDGVVLPITNTRISASEYNQIAASLMQIITSAGLTPDGGDNTQLLNAIKSFIGPYIVESWHGTQTWYRIWSDGYCEQGGTLYWGATRNKADEVTLQKAFANTNYSVFVAGHKADGQGWTFCVGVTPKSTTAFTYSIYGLGNNDVSVGMSWRASGYIS